MKLASIRRFRKGLSKFAKKGEMVLITTHGEITGCYLPLKETEEVPLELKKEFITTLGHQIASQLAAKKVSEKEIFDDFASFKKARRR